MSLRLGWTRVGSAARGLARLDSDIDLLVVKEGAHRRKLSQAIYRRLLGIGRSVDVYVVPVVC